jgi:hypothetical protein
MIALLPTCNHCTVLRQYTFALRRCPRASRCNGYTFSAVTKRRQFRIRINLTGHISAETLGRT